MLKYIEWCSSVYRTNNVISFVCSMNNKRKTGLVMFRSVIERLDSPQKTGQIVVNAVLTDDKRTVDTSTKLASHKLNQKSSTPKHIQQIRTAVEIIQ